MTKLNVDNATNKYWKKWHDTKQGLDKRNPNNHQMQFDHIINYTKIKDSDNYSILEFGANCGGLGKLLLDYKQTINNYTMIDDAWLLDYGKQNNLLNYNQVDFCPIPDVNRIVDNKYNLLISVGCLEETTEEYRDWVYDEIFPNVDEVFMIMSHSSSLWENFNESKLITSLNKHFSYVQTPTPAPGWRPTQFLYYATNKK